MVQWVDRNVIYHWHMLKCLGTDLSIMAWGKCTLKYSTGCIQLSQFPDFHTQELCNFEFVNCISIKKKNLTHLKNRWGKCGIILWKSRWVGMWISSNNSLYCSLLWHFFHTKKEKGKKVHWAKRALGVELGVLGVHTCLPWTLSWAQRVIFFSFFLYFAAPHGLWDLSSLTRDWTWALGSESSES